MCDLYDYSMDFNIHSFPAVNVKSARKEHECGECYRKIKVGDAYTKYPSLFEGEFCQVELCVRCNKAARWLSSRGHGWMTTEIRNDVRYCAAEEVAKARHESATSSPS